MIYTYVYICKRTAFVTLFTTGCDFLLPCLSFLIDRCTETVSQKVSPLILLLMTSAKSATLRTASVKKVPSATLTLFTDLQQVFGFYLKRAAAAAAACVATSRQELETPATTASDTAANPAPVEKRCTLEGCLQARTRAITHTHTPELRLLHINKC